ncbi:MAG: thioredoxin-disulfide reductase [candidate division WOR-3 bacterium]|jgi:thioredoxin reductase (NADPH)|nr:thioredoxin-disulfide reductase [candidate division WOR-3 bacterium]MCR4423910.1 thioredoxin-disulfide reductase [candidate division WOR-3 bacterium]MDH7519248.1 thioredoxin-disulfide reductase [bacterium]
MAEPEVLIVGAGPAGMTAGIYASRAGRKALVIESELIGGQVAKTAIVENYPGFAEPIDAVELVARMEAQARRFGCQFETGEVTGIDRSAQGLEVKTSLGNFNPGAVIICTGTKPRQLGVEGEERFVGRGISYCAICDGPLFRDQAVAVVGGGDSALAEANYLTRFCSRVYLIHRRDEFRAAKVCQERTRQNPKIELLLSRVITGFNGTNRLEGLTIKDLKTGALTTLPVAALFIYVGLVPNTGWCQGMLNLDEAGFIITDENLQTSLPGVFAAGDVRRKSLRQIATAVGDGALAAMMAHEYLNLHG